MKRVLVIACAMFIVGTLPGWSDSERDVADPFAPPGPVSPPDQVVLWAPDAPVMWDNGPLVNSPGTGAGGADESMLQSALGMGTYGFGHQFANGYRIADDFLVDDPSGWFVDEIAFFAYQTNSPTTSTISAVNLRIWDGVPGDPGSIVIWGDTTTNLMTSTTWSGIYRVQDVSSGATSRPVMVSTVAVGAYLGQGNYWLDWQSDGSASFSGPWAPPITINGVTNTGNGMQSLDSGVTWAPAMDVGGQDFPFIIEGVPAEGASPWIRSTYINDDAIGNSNGNDDLVIQAGETVELYSGLENVGGMDLIDPYVCLSTSSPWVIFPFNTCSSYPTIPPGQVVRNSDDFDITVDPATPMGHVIAFEAAVVAADGSTWDLEFSVVVGDMRIALLSDQSELEAVASLLTSMGIGFDHGLENWDGSQGRATSNADTLSNYSAVVWYASGFSSGRLTTPEELAALEAYLQGGGRLLVTGYDTMGSPTDTLMAQLVRSNSSGDGPFIYDWVVSNPAHGIMNGPFGAFPGGMPLSAAHSDHDQANADGPYGAVTVAELGDGTDKIIATAVPGTNGRVVYWNGNRDVGDWVGTPTLVEKGGGAKDRPGVVTNEGLLELAEFVSAQALPPRANGGPGGHLLSEDTLSMLRSTLEGRAVSSFAFPATGDTYTVASYPFWWHAGDRVEGGRNLSNTVDHVDYTIVMGYNSLSSGGQVDLALSINGVTVGTFSVYEGEFIKNVSFDFAPIPGPVYTIRLEETNAVVSGGGSIQIPPDLSTMVFDDSQREVFCNTLAWILEDASEVTNTIFRDSFDFGDAARWDAMSP